MGSNLSKMGRNLSKMGRNLRGTKSVKNGTKSVWDEICQNSTWDEICLGRNLPHSSVTPFKEKMDNFIEKSPDSKKMAYFKDILDGKQSADPIDQMDALKLCCF